MYEPHKTLVSRLVCRPNKIIAHTFFFFFGEEIIAQTLNMELLLFKTPEIKLKNETIFFFFFEKKNETKFKY